MQQKKIIFSQFRIKQHDDIHKLIEEDKYLTIDLKTRIQELLKQKQPLQTIDLDNASVELTREQIFILIVYMYLGLIESDLFQGGGFYVCNMESIKKSSNKINVSQQKLICIQQYFKSYLNKQDEICNEKVCFTKTHLDQNFDEICQKFRDSTFQSESIQFQSHKIETYDKAVVVDFADSNIGGLSLDPYNFAQEEIMMLIYPEALICMLFIPPLLPNEAVLIENVIKFNNYTGYEGSFKWKQQMKDQKNHILAIDAMPFSNLPEQVKKVNKNRELLKCFIGFDLAMKKQKNVTISTGKWGCGIFGGDVYLKSLIQIIGFLMAAELNDSKQSQLIISTMEDYQLLQFGKELCTKELGQYFNALEQLTNVEYQEYNLRQQITEKLQQKL